MEEDGLGAITWWDVDEGGEDDGANADADAAAAEAEE